MKRLYLVLGTGIVILGVVHMLATTRFFAELSGAALWFFSGGMMMVLIGALNLLNRAYGRIAPALRLVCIGATVIATVFGAVVGIVSQASTAEFALVLGLFGGAAAVSLSRASLAGREAPSP